MRRALTLIRKRQPELEFGEMHACTALLPNIRDRAFPDSRLEGERTFWSCRTLTPRTSPSPWLKAGTDGLPTGALLPGTAKPIHVVGPASPPGQS